MNASMLPLFGATFFAKGIRKLAESLLHTADYIEARRSLTRQQRAVLQRNAVFKDRHKGKPAFVIVNGPSLASQDILCLKDQISFVVSGFWKHEAVLNWQTTYYSLLDSNYFNNTESTKGFYENLNQRIQKSTFFLPLFRGFDAMAKNNFLPEQQTYYVATAGDNVSTNELTDVVQRFAGVSAFALSQAIYMGCNPIYLLGFDHNYLANRGVDQHFYQGDILKGHPSTNVPLCELTAYDDEMRANLHLWKNYRVLDAVAKSKNIKIYNASNGGYLDVFERVDYEKVISNLKDPTFKA
jgi:hypothetical protein